MRSWGPSLSNVVTVCTGVLLGSDGMTPETVESPLELGRSACPNLPSYLIDSIAEVMRARAAAP
jgi:hypothetical protein